MQSSLNSKRGGVAVAALATVTFVALFFVSANQVVKLTEDSRDNELALRSFSEVGAAPIEALVVEPPEPETCQMVGDVCYGEHKVGQLGATLAMQEASCAFVWVGDKCFNNCTQSETSTSNCPIQIPKFEKSFDDQKQGCVLTPSGENYKLRKAICYTELAQEQARKVIDSYDNNKKNSAAEGYTHKAAAEASNSAANIAVDMAVITNRHAASLQSHAVALAVESADSIARSIERLPSNIETSDTPCSTYKDSLDLVKREVDVQRNFIDRIKSAAVLHDVTKKNLDELKNAWASARGGNMQATPALWNYPINSTLTAYDEEIRNLLTTHNYTGFVLKISKSIKEAEGALKTRGYNPNSALAKEACNEKVKSQVRGEQITGLACSTKSACIKTWGDECQKKCCGTTIPAHVSAQYEFIAPTWCEQMPKEPTDTKSNKIVGAYCIGVFGDSCNKNYMSETALENSTNCYGTEQMCESKITQNPDAEQETTIQLFCPSGSTSCRRVDVKQSERGVYEAKGCRQTTQLCVQALPKSGMISERAVEEKLAKEREEIAQERVTQAERKLADLQVKNFTADPQDKDQIKKELEQAHEDVAVAKEELNKAQKTQAALRSVLVCGEPGQPSCERTERAEPTKADQLDDVNKQITKMEDGYDCSNPLYRQQCSRWDICGFYCSESEEADLALYDKRAKLEQEIRAAELVKRNAEKYSPESAYEGTGASKCDDGDSDAECNRKIKVVALENGITNAKAELKEASKTCYGRGFGMCVDQDIARDTAETKLARLKTEKKLLEGTMGPKIAAEKLDAQIKAAEKTLADAKKDQAGCVFCGNEDKNVKNAEDELAALKAARTAAGPGSTTTSVEEPKSPPTPVPETAYYKDPEDPRGAVAGCTKIDETTCRDKNGIIRPIYRADEPAPIVQTTELTPAQKQAQEERESLKAAADKDGEWVGIANPPAGKPFCGGFGHGTCYSTEKLCKDAGNTNCKKYAEDSCGFLKWKCPNDSTVVKLFGPKECGKDQYLAVGGQFCIDKGSIAEKTGLFGSAPTCKTGEELIAGKCITPKPKPAPQPSPRPAPKAKTCVQEYGAGHTLSADGKTCIPPGKPAPQTPPPGGDKCKAPNVLCKTTTTGECMTKAACDKRLAERRAAQAASNCINRGGTVQNGTCVVGSGKTYQQGIDAERKRQEAARKAELDKIKKANAAARKKAAAQQRAAQQRAAQQKAALQNKLAQQQDKKKIYEPKCAITVSESPEIAVSKVNLKYHDNNHEAKEENGVSKSGNKTVTPSKAGDYRAEIRVEGYFGKTCQDAEDFNVTEQATTTATTTTTSTSSGQAVQYSTHTLERAVAAPTTTTSDEPENYSWYGAQAPSTGMSFARVYATPNPLYVGGQTRLQWQGVGNCTLKGPNMDADLEGDGKIHPKPTEPFTRAGSYTYELRCGSASSGIVVVVLNQPTGYYAPASTPASTSSMLPPQVTESTTTSRCPVFTQYLKLGVISSQVTAAEAFLKRYGYFSGTPDTTFDLATEEAVKRFQAAHTDVILVPWGHTKPTGHWYKTSRSYANKLMGCLDPSFNPDLGDTL